ncbi:MAG TPA: nucleotidyltransferase family protein [Acidimicrobiales bacterium]|nr:nucleotidyltransferase family protein [Acidimicrobiales bacterium]
MSASPAGHEVADAEAHLAAVAAHGLPTTIATPSTVPLPLAEWDHLLARIRQERLEGLLNRVIADGALAVTPRQAEEAAAANSAAVRLVLRLEAVLLDTIDVLTRAGVEYRVLKGAAVARLDYPEPTLRSFVDSDVLVRSDQFDRAVAALIDAGHHRASTPQLREGFDRRFAKGATFLTADGLEIDLHRTLDRGPFGLALRLPDLWESSSTFVLAGRTLTSLRPEGRFLHACYHAALGDVTPRLVPLRDVAQMLLDGRLDLDLVRYLSSTWRANVVTARAVRLAWTRLGLDVETPFSTWALTYRPKRWEDRAMSVYLDSRRTEAARSLATLRFIPGAMNRLAYLGAVAFPSRTYLAARGRGRFSHWRRAHWPWRRTSLGRDDQGRR